VALLVPRQTFYFFNIIFIFIFLKKNIFSIFFLILLKVNCTARCWKLYTLAAFYRAEIFPNDLQVAIHHLIFYHQEFFDDQVKKLLHCQYVRIKGGEVILIIKSIISKGMG